MATILVADDDEQIVSLLAGILEAEGYEVITADNGADAVLLARKQLPDLLLLDIKMPRKTGIQVCAELKQDPTTRHIQIVMLSSAGQMKEIEEAMSYGASSYITKPSDRQHIIESVRAALNVSGEHLDWLHVKRHSK